MKKLYKKPEIEAVCYTANSALCVNCGVIAGKPEIEFFADIFSDVAEEVPEEYNNYSIADMIWNGILFSGGDGCSLPIEGAPFFMEGYCKFYGNTKMFLS